jgi:hypothetical protein
MKKGPSEVGEKKVSSPVAPIIKPIEKKNESKGLGLDSLKNSEPKISKENKPVDEQKVASLRAALKDALDKAK